MPEPTNDLPSLDALANKIEHAKPHKQKPGEAGVEYSKDLSIGIQLLVELVAGVAIGGGVGYFLDRALETSPACLIIFLLLGTAAGIRNMMKSDKAADAKHKDSQQS